MKQNINIKTKPSSYNREVYMSEYVTLPRDQVRMMKTREVIAWGIALFMTIIILIRYGSIWLNIAIYILTINQ